MSETEKRRSIIVAIEGIDGAGKTTACLALQTRLSAEQIHSVLIGGASFTLDDDEEWDDDDADDDDSDSRPTAIGRPDEVYAKISYLDQLRLRGQLGPQAYCLWQCAYFAQRWERESRLALEAGHQVIADRYVYSALVRDVIRGIDEAYVHHLYGFVPEPDMVFYIDVDPELAYERKLQSDYTIGYYEAGFDIFPEAANARLSFLAFQAKCRERYQQVLPADRTMQIDGARSSRQVHQEIAEHVLERLRDS
jgi:thymidylate kinase